MGAVQGYISVILGCKASTSFSNTSFLNIIPLSVCITTATGPVPVLSQRPKPQTLRRAAFCDRLQGQYVGRQS
jgi:hypothetical protein